MTINIYNCLGYVAINNKHYIVLAPISRVGENMKKTEAKKVLSFLGKELDNICNGCGIERSYVLELRDETTDVKEPWFGVELRVDGELYDLIYDTYSSLAVERLNGIEQRVLKGAGIDPSEHLFEYYGGGVLLLF